MAKDVELEKRIAENMARWGGSREFWEKRLTHGWDHLSAKLSEWKAKGMSMEEMANEFMKG